MDWTPQITTLTDQVLEHYVFPEVAESVVKVLRERLAAGAYTEITTDEALAEAVTADLQSVNGDKHLRLLHSVDEVPEHDAFDQAAYRQQVELSGHGIARVERLPGNVGYVDTRMFHWPGLAGERAVAAMTLVADTDALLFDLRRNVGGTPGMVSLLCTYLFGPDWPQTHLNSIYDRPADETQQYWTLPFVPGPRFGPDKPIYVLTGPGTFSAAEEFAYDLQTRGRATIVGERTKGGANPGGRSRVGPHLRSSIPSGRAVNPVTGTNWEGVGVAPDLAVPAEEAYDHAYKLALEHVLTLGETGYRRIVAEEAREALAIM
ncbi:S41 family peptidase [Nonomuraea sp. NBC_01738]|uniref:S41 family peptidase n=1 Tax=Nonomuraea sp. NBC_01738 TaxID=2976003 RepID=UPI002E145302|nr:S41 family peptidase [Nonomuraea sp. NBC_01738]